MVRISNLKILSILRKNARTPYVKIAKQLNVSETAVRKKIKQLEKQGIIKRYTIEIDLKKIGFEVSALVGVDTKPESYLQVIEKLKEMKEVVSLYPSTGDHMIMFECWFKKMRNLKSFIRRLRKIEGITKICPAIILDKIK